MKVTITRKCGHIDEIEVFGKNAIRERKIASAEKCLCEECTRINRLNAMSADLLDGWCELEGSEKQVLWAHDIRKEKAAELEKIAARTNMTEQFAPYMDVIRTRMSSAKYWIDNRSAAVQQISRDAATILAQ